MAILFFPWSVANWICWDNNEIYGEFWYHILDCTHCPVRDVATIFNLMFWINISSPSFEIVLMCCHKTPLMRNRHWFWQMLGAVRQQAITWVSAERDLRRNTASQGHNGLMSCWPNAWHQSIITRLRQKYTLTRQSITTPSLCVISSFKSVVDIHHRMISHIISPVDMYYDSDKFISTFISSHQTATDANSPLWLHLYHLTYIDKCPISFKRRVTKCDFYYDILMTYRKTSNKRRTLVGPCRHCSNYIFILDLTHSFNGLGKDNCKTRRESFMFWIWCGLC